MKNTKTQSHVLPRQRQAQAGTRERPVLQKAPPWPPSSCGSSHSVKSFGGQGDRLAASLLGHTRNTSQKPRLPCPSGLWGLFPRVYPPQGWPPFRGTPLGPGSGWRLRGGGAQDCMESGFARSLAVQVQGQGRGGSGHHFRYHHALGQNSEPKKPKCKSGLLVIVKKSLSR